MQAAVPNDKLEIRTIAINDLSLPFIEAVIAPALEPINTPEIQAWHTLVSHVDGIIFIVLNYNSGYPATIKNAIDVIWKAWFNKLVSIIGYAANQSDDGNVFLQSFTHVLHAIKTDPIKTSLYIPSALQKQADHILIDAAIQQKLTRILEEIYLATKQPSYFKQLSRNIGDTVKKKLIGGLSAYTKWQNSSI